MNSKKWSSKNQDSLFSKYLLLARNILNLLRAKSSHFEKEPQLHEAENTY